MQLNHCDSTNRLSWLPFQLTHLHTVPDGGVGWGVDGGVDDIFETNFLCDKT